jgi:hypothetical protein
MTDRASSDRLIALFIVGAFTRSDNAAGTRGRVVGHIGTIACQIVYVESLA